MRHAHPGVTSAHRPQTQQKRRSWLLSLAGAVLLVILALAGCANGQNTGTNSVPFASTGHNGTPGATSAATASGPATVQIADLNTFRSQLSSTFSKNTWSKLEAFLSPDFAFQGLNSGGNRLVMPDSALDFSKLYKSQGPWSQAAQYEVNIHFCDAGNTPANQQIGFDGGGGSFILIGITRWQGNWLVGWAFQDPLGGSDACATG